MGGLYNSLFLSMNCDLLDKLHISMMVVLAKKHLEYSIFFKFEIWLSCSVLPL